MGEIVTAVYEQGVLRPLTLLHLPEHAQVQVQIVARISASEERLCVRQALLEAGVIGSRPSTEPIQPVSEEELELAASELAAAGSLSELIIVERAER